MSDYGKLIERLMDCHRAMHYSVYKEAADALREQALELEQLKADPLHTMLMAQSTARLREIHRLQAELSALKASP